ncbi:MAG: hypothetical protein WBN68_20300 [Sedimenticolaceae bacterium]
MAISVGALLWQAVELSSMSQVSAQIDRFKPVASGIRLALISLLAVSWPRLVYLVCRSGRVDQGQRGSLLAQRWRVVGWLLVIEIVLGQDLLGRLLAAINGAAV